MHDVKLPGDADLIATRKVTSDIDTILESQGIKTSAKGEIASVTSVVGRLPAFDYMNRNGLCYMRIKKDIIFAKTAKGPVYIIPTDDDRIKFVIAQPGSADMVQQIQNSIAAMSE